jgi:DNA-directed RNA polymerase specialized sigma24 family protein
VPDDELALTLVDPDADAVTHLLVEERAAAMREALATLSQRDQLLLGMLAADPPVPYDEISRTLNMPIGSIGPTRARSMERLRRAAARVGLDAPG